jgi:hypothetical protein
MHVVRNHRRHTAVGGFEGLDPAPTPRAQFQSFVAAGRVHYFIGDRKLSERPDRSPVTRWVEENFRAIAIGGLPVHDLTRPRHR